MSVQVGTVWVLKSNPNVTGEVEDVRILNNSAYVQFVGDSRLIPVDLLLARYAPGAGRVQASAERVIAIHDETLRKL